jgi:AcrR family transcriptional regulator
MTESKPAENSSDGAQPDRDLLIQVQKPGRPRSTEVHLRILSTALGLARLHDYADISIERVAREAGVAKTTIYRWWKSKAELMFEATSIDPLHLPNTGSLRGDLAKLLEQYATDHLQEASSRIELGLLADLARTPQDPRAALLQETRLQHERGVVQNVLDRALHNGDLMAPQDCDLALALLKGLPQHLRLVLGVSQESISNDLLVTHILAALKG